MVIDYAKKHRPSKKRRGLGITRLMASVALLVMLCAGVYYLKISRMAPHGNKTIVPADTKANGLAHQSPTVQVKKDQRQRFDFYTVLPNERSE